MTGLVYTPLSIERRAIQAVMDPVPVLRVGMGCRTTLPETAEPVVVAGVAGGLAPEVLPGDVVVADEIRRVRHSVPILSAPLVAGALRRLGLAVHCGPIVSSDRIVDGKARTELATSGALAVDLESATLAATGTGPVMVIRSIVDTALARLWAPGTVWRGVRALRSLRTAAPALRWWLTAIGPRQITLAAPQQKALNAMIRDDDLILVLAAEGCSNSAQLVKVARREGALAYLVNSATGIDLRWLAGASRVGIISGATAPPTLAGAVVRALSGLGPVTVRDELPRELA